MTILKTNLIFKHMNDNTIHEDYEYEHLKDQMYARERERMMEEEWEQWELEHPEEEEERKPAKIWAIIFEEQPKENIEL